MFVQALEHLIKSKQYAAAFAIIHLTLRTQRQHVVLSKPFASMFHKKALRYAMSQKKPDFKGEHFRVDCRFVNCTEYHLCVRLDALDMLLADQRPADILQYLSTELKSGYQKINYLTLAEMYSGTLGDKQKTRVSRRT